MMLEISNLSSGYGAIGVLRGVSLTVEQGEMVALVGANGAGKTTLLKTISGLLKATSGSISLAGTSLDRLPPVARVRLGLAHVPEGRQVFSDLSVYENLELGAYTASGLTADAFKQRVDYVSGLFPALVEKMHLPAGGLSGGQQQMLAIARGLVLNPTMIMLDEPSLGLSPVLVTEIFKNLERLRETGVSILLSEQNARLSLAIADRGYVIETGKIVQQGTGKELLNSSEVMERYLGVGTSSVHTDAAGKSLAIADRLRAIL
jgi:branched-chain amino acid transport system ATP-binding protein